jgi:hypothetical protein
LGDEFGRLLQIGRHDREELALTCGQAGADGREGTEVARQEQKLRAEGCLGQAGGQPQIGIVGAAVDDKDHLQFIAKLAVQARERLQERLDVLGVAVNRDDQ